jgi:hypothetical protein
MAAYRTSNPDLRGLVGSGALFNKSRPLKLGTRCVGTGHGIEERFDLHRQIYR